MEQKLMAKHPKSVFFLGGLVALLLSILSSMLVLFIEHYEGFHDGYFMEILQNNGHELFVYQLGRVWLYFLASVAAIQLFLFTNLFAELPKRAVWVGGGVAIFMMLVSLLFPSTDTSSGLGHWIMDFLYFNGVITLLPFALVAILSCVVVQRLASK